jgi:hypothetical protein
LSIAALRISIAHLPSRWMYQTAHSDVAIKVYCQRKCPAEALSPARKQRLMSATVFFYCKILSETTGLALGKVRSLERTSYKSQ